MILIFGDHQAVALKMLRFSSVLKLFLDDDPLAVHLQLLGTLSSKTGMTTLGMSIMLRFGE
jgi:hypothetical protein